MITPTGTLAKLSSCEERSSQPEEFCPIGSLDRAQILTLNRHSQIMDNPITASFRWSADELLTAQRIHWRYSKEGRKLRRGRWTMAPLGFVVGVFILVRHGFHPISLLGLFLLLAATFLLLIPLIIRRATLKQYASRPDRDMVMTWEFYPDRLANRTEASSSTMEWRMISRVLQSPQGFLLHPTERAFHWVPAHAFQTPADKEAFVQLARSNVRQFDNFE